MKNIKINLETKADKIKIIPIADIHQGDRFCDMDLFNKTIKKVLNEKDTYCVLNGDLINNAIKSSVSNSYEEKISPQKQLEWATEVLYPIRDKILCITSGNHENRTARESGIDITKVIAAQLEIEDRFCSESALLFISFGALQKTKAAKRVQKMLYTIFVTHGTGGGRKAGGKVNGILDLSSIVDADVYIRSHTHTPFVIRQTFYRLDLRTKTSRPVDKLFVSTASYLDYGGYADRANYVPVSKKNPTIYLCNFKHEVFAVE